MLKMKMYAELYRNIQKYMIKNLYDNTTDEVYDLPKGTRIYNHDASQDQVLKTAEAVARRIVKENGGGGGKGTTQNVTINSPSPISPSEVARQMRNVNKELAMGI